MKNIEILSKESLVKTAGGNLLWTYHANVIDSLGGNKYCIFCWADYIAHL